MDGIITSLEQSIIARRCSYTPRECSHCKDPTDYTAIMDVFQGQTDEASFAEIDEEEFIPELQTSNDVQVPPVHCPLAQSDFNRLQQTIDPLGRCNNYGISIYLDTKSFVENCMNAT